MIIIEGADNLGKTTLAKALAAELKFDHNHLSKPQPHEKYDLNFFMTEAFGSRRQIRDRFHLGTLVYGEMLGLHENHLSSADLNILTNFLRWRKCYIILLVSSQDGWYKDHLRGAAKDEMFSFADMVLANKVFRSFSGMVHITYNVDNGFPNPTEIIESWKRTTLS